MFLNRWFLFSIFCLAVIFSTSQATSPYYDTTSNLTHTCNISPMVVCVDINAVYNKTCVDPKCLIYSGGNISLCLSPIVSCNNSNTNVSRNCTVNRTIHSNTTISTCNATWIYQSNKTSFCYNATSWNKTVCSVANVTCKINSSQCTLNPVVYLGGFFNLRGKDGYGNIPAAEIAINQINKDNTTLENITLSLVSKESTQSLLSYGTQLLYNYLHSGPTKLMLLLPQEDDIAKTVAAYAGLQQWGTLQFSYGTKDNSLASNKKLFPRFFRLNSLAITYNRLRAEFVHSFPNWILDVGLLYYADTYHKEVNDDLNERLKAKGINVVANVGFKSDPAEALYILKEKNAHVILTTFPYWYGKKMFCKAFQLSMYGPHYVWITFTLMPYKFWIPTANDDLDCSEYEMNCVVENHFSFYGATTYKPTNTLINEPNVTFSQTYNDVLNSTKNRTNTAPYVYDAIWTMANILERARPVLEKKGKVLNNLSYGDETELLERLAYETDFNGVTGRIRFYKDNGNRKFAMDVLQVRRSGVGHFVGNYDEDKDEYTVKDDILWQGFKESDGGWPYQRTTRTYKWRYIELSLFVVWCILAILGMIYAIFCLVFVIIYRREGSIKYSSPTINVLIILGCLFNFIAVVLYGIDYQRASESRMTVICKVRLWMFSLGFTFCIGGLWVKVWTLYQILIERKVHGKRKMEYWMFGIVMILLAIDVVYLTTWTAINGLYRSFETVTDQPKYKCFQKLSSNPFIASVWYIEICDCENLALWSAIFLTYKTLLLLFGAYMSWKVRKVYTRKLVDAQYCATLLLLAVPFCVLGLIFAYSLRLFPTPHYAMMGILIIIYTYIVLGFLYGHKIINIFCCPRNMIKVRSKGNTGSMNCCSRLAACLAPIAACLAAGCCCICCHLNCCKALYNALLHGPRKNRGSFVKENEKLDYQIGDMPSDREKQIIILQKEIEKREEELKRLRRNNRATLATKETQTMDDWKSKNRRHLDGGYGCHDNEGFTDEKDNNKRGSEKQNYNRFKIYHRKLDFSHVGSKVDSGLDRSSNKRGSLPVAEADYDEQRRGSSDSEVLLLQKTLSERDKELAQLRAYLGMDPSSSTELSSKLGSLASIGEEHNVKTSTESEAPNRNVSSVAITIQSSESDGDSKQTGSDISNDDAPSDASNEQTVELLQNNKTAADQEIQMGILPDTKPAVEVPEHSKEEGENTQEGKKKHNSKVLSSPYGSLTYISRYNAKSSGGKFKKKVQQLNAFGIFARKPTNDENTPKKVDSTSNESQVNGGNEEKLTSDENDKSKNGMDEGNDKSKNYSSGDNGERSKSNVKIFNEPSNWSHVKSRLFDPNANTQNTLKTSPNTTRKLKVGIDDDGDQKTGNSDEKIRNVVTIFNSSSDYSHVKSRLFDANANQVNSENLLKPSSNIRRKSKVGIEDDAAISGDELSKRRGSVKIFNAPSDYSHIKSKLFDADASSSRRSSRVIPQDIINDVQNKQGKGQEKEDRVSKTSNNVKIFNAPSDYSHIKSKLFDADASSNRRSPQVNPQDINNVQNKQENEKGQEKENQVSKTSNNIKIFNAPSDYSHVKSRLYDSSNTAKGQDHETSALKVKNTNVGEQDTQNKKASTDV